MKGRFVEDGPTRMPREPEPPPGSPLGAWLAWFVRRFVVRPFEDARKLWIRKARKDDLADDLS